MCLCCSYWKSKQSSFTNCSPISSLKALKPYLQTPFLFLYIFTSILNHQSRCLCARPFIYSLGNISVYKYSRGITKGVYTYYFPSTLILYEYWCATLSCACFHVIKQYTLCFFYYFSFASIEIRLVFYLILLNWISKEINTFILMVFVVCYYFHTSAKVAHALL